MTMTITNITTTSMNSTALPPSTAAHPHISYMSPLNAGLCLVAFVTITMISYIFFMAIRNIPFWRIPAAPQPMEVSCKSARNIELVGGVKFKKMTSVGGDGEPCPVCLSVLAEGEEIGELSACKHAFHAACVDRWLQSHSSCPVCRAAVPVRRSKCVLTDGEDDFRHGLPDAASLI